MDFKTTLNFGGSDTETNTTENVTPVEPSFKLQGLGDLTLEDIFAKVASFISLDISKTSTGWVRYVNGVIEKGYFTITSDEDDLLGQRKEFRGFLKELFQDRFYEYVFIEDTIGSINYKTARILHQLNPQVDDMMDFGVIPTSPIIREGNGIWKKNLKYISNYKPIINGENDKISVRNALKILGFGDGTTDTIREDIYDAVGIAVGVIVRLKMIKEQEKKVRLRKDIGQVYKIEQYSDEYEALDRANELDRKIHNLNYSNIARDLKFNFKNYITDQNYDGDVYVITIPTSKIGSLALKKKFDLDIELSYLVVYINAKVKKKLK